MGQITAPIIAITLVLLSVFVPVAFIPGISGELFRQFAVAVSVSMVISAINALTLSPALCARVPARMATGRSAAPSAMCCAALTGRATAMRRSCGGWCAWRCSAWSRWPSSWRARVGCSRMTPTGFLPSEDQGAFFVEVQLPEGASVNRTDAVARRVEEIIRKTEGIAGVTTVVGYSMLDGQAKSNSALLVMTLKPFAERKDPALSANGLIAELKRRIRRDPRRPMSSPSTCRRSSGLGTGSGFEYQLQSLSGAERRRHRGRRTGPHLRRQPGPGSQRVFTTYAATTPQLYLDIDREKAADARRRHLRRLHRAAGDARRRLRQRFQSVRPHLAGQRAGRGGRSQPDR